MTEKLKTLMHTQADAVDFAAPDVDAMVRTGERRRRTRHLGGLAGAAALAAGIALAVPLLAPAERGVEPAGPVASTPLSWVDGTTLHEGARTFALDFRPRAFVRTAEGYVFSDRDGRVWSWQDDEATLVGRTDDRNPHLVADAESGLAGFVAQEGPEYVVVDQEAGTVTGYDAPRGTEPEDFAAIDDGTGYWQSAAGLVAFDLRDRRSTPLDVRGTLADVEDDLLAVRTHAGVSVRTLDGQELQLLDEFHGEVGSFSPDARYFTNDADVPQVYDVTAGEQVDVPVGTREFASGYEWLDGSTLALIASAESVDDSPVQLVSCVVPAGPCTTGTTLGTFEEAADRLVLPIGIPIDG